MNGRKKGGQYYILKTCDQERFEARKVVFSWECLNIFATGCSVFGEKRKMKLAGVSSIKTLPRSRSQKVSSISITAFEPVSFSGFFPRRSNISIRSFQQLFFFASHALCSLRSKRFRREIWNESKKLKRNEGERACFNDDKVYFTKLVICSICYLRCGGCQFTNEPSREISMGIFQNREVCGHAFP